jgi:hypothetical protein
MWLLAIIEPTHRMQSSRNHNIGTMLNQAAVKQRPDSYSERLSAAQSIYYFHSRYIGALLEQ